MVKKNKLSTPGWIIEGYDSEEDYNKSKGLGKKKKSEKTFKIRECPKCGSDKVGIVLSGVSSESSTGTGKNWECHKCKWHGSEIKEQKLTEEELMVYLDKKGEKCC